MKKIIIGLILALSMYFPIAFTTQYHALASSIAIVLIASISYYFFLKDKQSLKALIAISLFAIIIETIGLITGFPYSHFSYTETLGHKLFGTTPWTVFFAFTPLVLGAIRYADIIAKKVWGKITLAVTLLVAIDLILDPVAVAQGFWTWQINGLYYGVPFINFLGWIFTSLIAIGIYFYFKKFKTIPGQELSYYYSVWIWTGASLFLNLWIPLLIGIILIIIMHKVGDKK